MSRDITRAIVLDFRHVFDMFDEDGDEHLEAAEFAEIVALLGDEAPSQQHLQEMLRTACETPERRQPPQRINFSQFLAYLAVSQQDWPTEISDDDVFNALDQGRGAVSPSELREVLHRCAKPISEDEAHAMARFASPSPRPPHITAPDVARVATRVRQLREAHAASSSRDCDEPSSTDNNESS